MSEQLLNVSDELIERAKKVFARKTAIQDSMKELIEERVKNHLEHNQVWQEVQKEIEKQGINAKIEEVQFNTIVDKFLVVKS